MPKRPKDSEFLRVVRLMPRRRLFVFVLTTMLRAVITALCLNLVMGLILRDVLNAAVLGELALVERALYMMLGAFFIGEPLVALFQYVNRRCLTRTMAEIRQAAFDRMTHLTVDHFEREHSGDLLTRMTDNVQNLEHVFSQDFGTLVGGLVLGGLTFSFIFAMEWRMGLLILGINVVNVLLGLAFRKPTREVSDRSQENQAALAERFLDLVRGSAVTRMFGAGRAILKRFAEKNDDLSAARIREAGIEALSGSTENAYSFFKQLGVLTVGLFLVMRQQADVGSVGAIIFMGGYADWFFRTLSWFIPHVQRNLAGASRVLALLDQPTEAEVHSGRTTAEKEGQPTTGDRLLVLKEIHFSYGQEDDVDVPVLNGLDLAVERGQVVALVGPSGGGKSTIVKLLMGFYPFDEGSILVAGKPIGAYSLEELRDLFAYVPQNAYLFDGTIEENIRYGRPGVSQEEVRAAARAANAHGFIAELPDGYRSTVGESGANLSGGERQRIAIARALLKDAPILLLDEATSALDSESELLVQQALNVLMEGRTTIAIAHRLSTVEHADVICVVDQGRVVEQGRHDELLARRGTYHRLHELSFRERST